MKSNIKIYCANLGEYIEVEGGTTLLEISRQLAPRLGFEPICARVNNKNEALAFPVFQPKKIEFLSINNPSGERTYIRSLCMVLYLSLIHI